MTPALSVDNLSVNYGSHTALDSLTVDFLDGEVVGLIGPNGAGKTSFIRALCGRIPDMSGSISVDGEPLERGQSRKHFLGLVPQEIGLYPHMTCLENLDVFSKYMGVTTVKRKAAVEMALKTVELESKADARIDTLSGGMKRRLNVAAAIMHGPRLLILDEPTAGVDIPARDNIHRLAASLAKSGICVLLVTHELEQAEALCDRILILADGKALAFDTASNILKRSFGNKHEIMLRFAAAPKSKTQNRLKVAGFSQGELPTIWTAMTQSSAAEFIKTLPEQSSLIAQAASEISLRRPGLAMLMRRIEKTGALK